MKPQLRFETLLTSGCLTGDASPLPDLLGSPNLQNKTAFYLDEHDEIFEGYGKVKNSFPYCHYTAYRRNTEPLQLPCAILENNFLRAVFLPTLGGRLWQLTDKATGRELLYTNDVIRPSNLAIRNAWFSGGVEWNISLIGHTPFTMDPLFTARLQSSSGNPVLRMYEYERVRGVAWQMDFWLDEQDTFLNCRMRIHNETDEVVPMYWWSNMAVPEYSGGRVVVPAKEAYTNRTDSVHKVPVPLVDGIDISRYNNIPSQVDYFFKPLPGHSRFIANLGTDGYGLLQRSTEKLQSRKLFSWGNNDASRRWQEFLTQDAGPYVEIQAGLGQTQYGCLPLAPHTAWEWLEQYGAVQLGGDIANADFSALAQQIETALEQSGTTTCELENILTSTRPMAKTKAEEIIFHGGGWGALANLCRKRQGLSVLSSHLEFGSPQTEQLQWIQLLDEGTLPCPDALEPPKSFTADPFLLGLLHKAADGGDAANWYAHYLLGAGLSASGKQLQALERFERSLSLAPNPWAYHGIAAARLLLEEKEAAAHAMLEGLKLCHHLAYVKEGLRILLAADTPQQLLEILPSFPREITQDSRVMLFTIVALHRLGRHWEAYELLTSGQGLEVADLREGEDSLGPLWLALYRELYQDEAPLPHHFNFYSL